MPIKTNLRNVSQAVLNREEFQGSNLCGRSGYTVPTIGMLPSQYQADFAKARNADDFYAVFSYSTPIAWYANGQWFVPNVRYSVSTSRQLSSLGLPIRRIDAEGKPVQGPWIPLDWS